MKNNLKSGVVCACAAAVLGLFVSCAPKENFISVEMWYKPTFGEAGAPPADWEVYNIIKRKLGIDLTFAAVPSSAEDAEQKIMAAAAAGKLPDVFAVNSETLTKLMQADYVTYVDDMYDYMPVRTAQMYDAASRQAYSKDGKHYGLRQPGSITKNEGILIRKDWLDRLELSVPVTLDDYMEVMKAFTFRDPDGNGKNDTYGFGAFLEIKKNSEGLGTKFEPFFGAFGVPGTISFERSSAGLNIYKEEYYSALDYIRSMTDEKVIDPNWTVYKKDDFRNAWKAGKFGIMREQNAAFALQNNYTPFDERFPDGEWIVIDPPSGPDGKKSVGIYTDQGHRLLAVSKKAREQGKIEAIARLLEWMSGDEGYYRLGFGEEGVNYNKDENGFVTAENLPNPELAYSQKSMASYLQLRNIVFYNSEIELAGRYPAWTSKNGKTISAYAVLKDMQSRDWTPCFGSEGIPSPSGELKKIYEQGVLDFVTGKRALNPENWQEWLNMFTRQGGMDWERKCLNYAESRNLLTE